MNEITNNKVNLCDSCSQVYPDCTSKPKNVYFGDGAGHDNICACSEYRPSAQPETHDKRTETHACDCVSGVAAIVAAIEAVDEWDGGYNVQRANMIRDAIKALPSAQPEEDCNTCKHGYFGDTCCNNCRVRFTSHYERRQDADR